MMSSYDGMWFGGGYMWFFWILIPLAIIWAFKSMSDNGDSRSSKSDPSDSSIEILKKRYANGEINKQEYNEQLDELKK